MGKAFDCSVPLSYDKAKQFAEEGYTHAIRYLVPRGWKHLTKEEAITISEAGLQIVSVFEIMGDLESMSNTQGIADGQSALECAANVGQPEGSTIYFAIDFEPTPQQLPLVLEYIRACSEATPNYYTGVYGSYDVIEYIAANNGCSHFWQTYAWSHGYVSQHNNLYQDENGVMMHGIEVDHDVTSGNEGGWTVVKEQPQIPVEQPQTPVYPLTQEDAKKFAAMASALFRLDAHEISYSDGTVYSNMDHDEYHRLANVARALGGLTIV